ncbi:putative two-component system sensor kinase [Nocardia farcinica IFM 10152]|uniref:Putative two-component system sensor kinase n=1 Tax=Nocardia farcinica (strain IFM 10152) TaxID=247156 RepID=Q5YN97_NOCFA|nr:putative two-component system sensor kinase [Nocardia farcinica IFM 10152]
MTLLYAIGQQIASVPYYHNQRLSWVFIALMVVWSGASALLLSQWRSTGMARVRAGVVVGDHVVVIGLIAATRLVADYDWYHGHQTLPTTMWAANAVISAAILRGWGLGIASGLLISAVIITVREQWGQDVWTDATAPVLVSVGLALGLAADTARRAQDQLRRAVRLTAAAEERERLAREVHDGVLQVLSYIKRRGAEIGGPTEELAQRAGEQEVALRVLISEQGGREDAGGSEVDLRPLLTAHATPTVFVSTPGEPVRVGRWVAGEIAAAVATALANVDLHAGPDAKAYVLLEDTGAELIVSVRDDGVGIPPGRLAEAEAEGRMGVSRSIVGRIAALGGQAELLSDGGDGEGVEWEFRVPRG